MLLNWALTSSDMTTAGLSSTKCSVGVKSSSIRSAGRSSKLGYILMYIFVCKYIVEGNRLDIS